MKLASVKLDSGSYLSVNHPSQQFIDTSCLIDVSLEGKK